MLGTALLDEQELVIQFTEGGLVTIDELYRFSMLQVGAIEAVVINS